MEGTVGHSHAARAFNFGLLVAMMWVPFELNRVGWGGDLAWATVALFVALGVMVGMVIESEAYLVRRLDLGAFPSALIFALGSWVATIPVGRKLFAGSFAATLPGASTAPYWLPVGAYGALAIGLWVCIAVERRCKGNAWNVATGFVLMAFAFFVEGSNRHTRVSEYPDLHTFAVLLVFVASYMALGQFAKLLGPLRPDRQRWLAEGLVPALLAPISFAVVTSAAIFSLSQAQDRLTLARDGQHSRWLVRGAQATIDIDRDGHAQIFGGPDCDDLDPGISPDAQEVEGNQIDENCDGRLSDLRPPVATEAGVTPHARPDLLQSGFEASENWRNEPEVHRAIAALGRPHLVLISVDALRADMLRDSTRNREQFPELFALLDASTVFDHAFSAAAGTDLSMSTLMTGRTDAFAPTPATLAEHLRDAGWFTTSVVPSEVLRYAGQTLLKRGFLRTTRLVNDGQEQDVGRYSSSARGTRLALDNVDRYLTKSSAEGNQEQGLALWMHYFDAHEHDELSPYDRQLRARTKSRDPVERYRAALALVDAGIGDLRRGLEERGIWQDAIVVLVSDHGEALGEDPRLPDNHGRVLYAPLTDIPLAIRLPGAPGRHSSMPAALVDLMPTLLSLLDIETQTRLDGLDLAPELLGPEVAPPEHWEALRNRPLAMYESDQEAVVSWPYKLMWRPKERVYELFDLEADPREEENLAASRESLRAELAWTLSQLPRVELDRSTSGRRAREQAAKAGAEGGDAHVDESASP